MADCVILIGLQGAGKTTFFRQAFAPTHEHISKDLWPNTANRTARQRSLLDRTLAEGRPAVIDNVNARVSDRALVIATAKARGARVVGYFFDLTTRQAVARNAERSGKARVPNVAIF